MRKLDLTGQKFGRLTAVEEVGRSRVGKVLWRCRCDCGNETIVSSGDLRSGRTTSCGCFRREYTIERETKHGMRKHQLYNVWHGIMRRTGVLTGANDKERRNYIERGISVCDEWKTIENFTEWALSHGYEKGLTIDRIDNARDYCPENCRWVTPKQNSNNRRNTAMLCGCSLAMLCSELGIGTCEDHRLTKAYNRISSYHLDHNGQRVHPDLVFAMLRDTEKQQQLLDETITKRKRAEAELARLKALLKR